MESQTSELTTLALPSLWQRFQETRARTEALCQNLNPDDFCVQIIPEVSPPKWHLAHTTWFFENFLLKPCREGYREFNPAYRHLFNSYYHSQGSFHDRNRRGLFSRPTVHEIYSYRRKVNESLHHLMVHPMSSELVTWMELGLAHEEQHQELLLMDIKAIFNLQPLKPVYRPRMAPEPSNLPSADAGWTFYEEGLYEIGADNTQFAFDHEKPRHRVYVDSFRLAKRPVTNGEYLEFMRDGGYSKPHLWLSDGWRRCQEERWAYPLYWEPQGGQWLTHTLSGPQLLNPVEPVTHISYYEADAYARWKGKRLPTEAEWEIAASTLPVEGNFLESDLLHPRPVFSPSLLPQQMFGDVWEWTSSAFTPYPGYVQPPGALGEYNGKFMCNQYVLKGGCCVSPERHLRPSYRNFYQPEARWAFTGLRLAEDFS